MPSALVATVGSANSNTYLTLAEADALMGDRLDSAAWDALSEDDKTRALLQATRRLDACRFWGDPVSETQALAFPRTRQLDTTIIPPEVQAAQLEEALAIAGGSLAGGGISDLIAQGVTAHSIGGFSQTFGGAGMAGANVGALAPAARRALGPWVRASGRIRGPRDGAPTTQEDC